MIAHVTPLHKKGPENLCNNYRPISLLSDIVQELCESRGGRPRVWHKGLLKKNRSSWYKRQFGIMVSKLFTKSQTSRCYKR